MVTDTCSRLHVFEIIQRGPASFEAPSDSCQPESNHADAETSSLARKARMPRPRWGAGITTSSLPGRSYLCRCQFTRVLSGVTTCTHPERKKTRRDRIEAAIAAHELRGVLDALTQEDLHMLVPRAYAHAEIHPELYRLPSPLLPPGVLVHKQEAP